MQQENAIQVEGLSVDYGDGFVFKNLDVQLPAGKIIGIMGPNGSGKSTLINAMLGLVKKSSGNVRILGLPAEKVRGKIAYVPQKDAVDWDFPISVMEVVLMGIYPSKGLFTRITSADRQLALECLEKVKLKELSHRQAGQLSGGQKQRLFIARALAQRAEIYFLDEPFAGVDMLSEKAIMEILRELRSEGKTIILVHHDLHTVKETFDWLVLMNGGIVASGAIADIFTQDYLQQAYGGRSPLIFTGE